MPSPVSIRVADILARLPEAERSDLLARLGVAADDGPKTTAQAAAETGAASAANPSVPPVELTEPGPIHARVERLDDAARDLLHRLLVFDPGFLDLAVDEGDDLSALQEAGLAFALEDEGHREVALPVEVRIALLDDVTRSAAPAVALLGEWEMEELEELGALHGVDLSDTLDDRIGAAIAVADALTDVERLDGVFDSLPSASKRLTHWLCEVEDPVPLAKAAAKARRFAELAGEGAGTAEKVLVRLGVAQEIDVDGDELLVVPFDVREALRPIIETSLSERCRTMYESLRESAVPAFRDVFPHGAGGNALAAARQRIVRAALVGPDTADRLDRVLMVFRVLSSEQGVGELASLHVDVGSPERFAQECLRSWLGSLDDDFTRILVEPFDGDTVALADWILGDEEGNEGSAAEEWGVFLHDLRANLLFTLSVLSPGHWYPMAPLVDLVAAIYRRLLWHAGGFHGVDDGVPEHAFPMPGVDVTTEEEARLYEALIAIFADLLEPIGAVRFDESGRLFMVNTESFRLFRDGDPGFDTLWTDAESYVGDDVDLWMPIPTAYGSRISGVARLSWVDDVTIEVAADPHCADLLRLVRWANPLFVGGPLRFVFDATSVARGIEAGGSDTEDADAFLLWLAVRTGDDIPGTVRALFPLSTSSADGEEPVVEAMRAARRQVDELDQWGETPPIDLMESIRSQGTAAAGVVLDALAGSVEAAEWELPALRHLCVLAGELGVIEATPLLLRVLGQATFEPAEGAAATALARIGAPALDGLEALLENPILTVNKRLAAAGALSALAVLHPVASGRVVDVLVRSVAAPDELPEDVPTLVGLFVAETGHVRADQFLTQLREQGLWMDSVMAFDEALWIAGISPALWGHPMYAAALAQLYPPRSEAERARDEAIEPPPTKRRR